jgi:hypothetical protein
MPYWLYLNPCCVGQTRPFDVILCNKDLFNSRPCSFDILSSAVGQPLGFGWSVLVTVAIGHSSMVLAVSPELRVLWSNPAK